MIAHAPTSGWGEMWVIGVLPRRTDWSTRRLSPLPNLTDRRRPSFGAGGKTRRCERPVRNNVGGKLCTDQGGLGYLKETK